MPAPQIKQYQYLLILLLALNVVPFLGVKAGLWPQSTSLYLYWGECAFIALGALVLYAKRLSVFFIILAAAGAIVSLINDEPVVSMNVSMTFWALYCLCWVAYIEMSHSAFGLLMKRLDPEKQLFLYGLFMVSAIVLCFIVTATMYNAWDILGIIPAWAYAQFALIAVGVPTLSIVFLKIIDMIGPRHFFWFLFGTYHRPVEMDRIVVFLDMVGSSAVAEKLRPTQSMAFIARFIFDATAVFRMHGGDVVNYTGDGLVVLWPRRQAEKPLAAVAALRHRLHENAPIYTKEFGIIPDFRIGIHAGKIVISQIGEEKLFLGVYGDTVNTAARLEQLNKELKTKVLVSDALLPGLTQAQLAYLQPMGTHDIRGKNEKIEVFTLRKLSS